MNQTSSMNPLLGTAVPLLMLACKIQKTEPLDPSAVLSLRQQIVEELNVFTEHASAIHCTQRHILAARYCLCTALDEFVLSTSWGSQSPWPQQTLLSIVHKETSGGERFFIILEEMTKFPKENLCLLELLYIILSLGFEGKYYNQEQSIRDQVRHQLYHLIKINQQEQESSLSPSSQLIKKTKTNRQQRWSKLHIAGVTAAILLGLGLVFNYLTYLAARKPLAELWAINQEAAKIPLPSLDPPAPVALATPNPSIVMDKPVLHHKHHHRMRRTA